MRLAKTDPKKWAYIIDFVDKNAKRPSVTFAEVAEAAEGEAELNNTISNDSQARIFDRSPYERESIQDLSNVNIDDIKIVYDSKEVLSISQEDHKKREELTKERVKWTYEELKQSVNEAEIKSSHEYEKKRQDYGWCSYPTLVGLPGAPKNEDGSFDWDEFLKREKKTQWTYDSQKAAVISNGVTSSSEYRNLEKKYGWLSINTLISLPEFPKKLDGSNDWDAFFEREKLDFKKLKEQVRSKGVKSSAEYAKLCSANSWPTPQYLTSLPEFPKKLEGSNDWDAFLGREYTTYESVKKAVQEKKVTSLNDYLAIASDEGWPGKSRLVNMEGFPKTSKGLHNWENFFGKEDKTEWDYKTIQEAVQAKGVKSSGEYTELRQNEGWPTATTITGYAEFPKKANGSNDWDKFLGRENKDYSSIKTIVQSNNIKSYAEYIDRRKELGLPTDTTLTKMPEFPKKPDGLNDWKRFFDTEN